MKLKAHEYQKDAAKFMWTHPHSAVFADPGTGKTAISLMLISELKRHDRLKPVLILGPLRIISSVWPDEIDKWDQFNNITYRVIHGKHKAELVKERADIHLVNNEGLIWLEKNGHLKNYHILIIDESSKYKNWSAKRVKLLKKYIHRFHRRHILTGSPTPRSLLDLFAQMFLCDGGKSLGQFITHYRAKHFDDRGFGVYQDWQLREGHDKIIYDLITPHCYRLDATRVLSLPEMIVNDIKLTLPKDILKASLETLKTLDLDLPVTAVAEYLQNRKLSGGCLSDGLAHDIKINALRDLIDELCGKPVLVFFYYRDEGRVLSDVFNAPRIDGTVSPSQSADLMHRWNNKRVPVLLCQPAAAGHGLNLQHGGNDIVWFSLTDNQDDYYQANRRIWRQGVAGQVRIHRLLAKGSVDTAIARSLESKTNQQKALLDAIRDLREEYL